MSNNYVFVKNIKTGGVHKLHKSRWDFGKKGIKKRNPDLQEVTEKVYKAFNNSFIKNKPMEEEPQEK